MNNQLQLINQLLEIKQKIAQEKLESKFERNFNRIFSILEDEGYLTLSLKYFFKVFELIF